MPPGYLAQLKTVARPPGIFYRNAEGVETVTMPRWVFGVFLATWAVLALLVAIIALIVMNTLADIRAYQSTTYAQCKAAAAVCESKKEGEK